MERTLPEEAASRSDRELVRTDVRFPPLVDVQQDRSSGVGQAPTADINDWPESGPCSPHWSGSTSGRRAECARPANSSFTSQSQSGFGKDPSMTRWQLLAETNPSASPEQQTLFGLMVLAELENSSPQDTDQASLSESATPPNPA